MRDTHSLQSNNENALIRKAIYEIEERCLWASLLCVNGGMKMITGDKELDSIMELAEAVFVCPDPSKHSKEVVDAKYEAIRKTLSCTQHYRKHGIMSELVHAVFTKKLKMIKEADTVKDLKAIEKGVCSPLQWQPIHPRPFPYP